MSQKTDPLYTGSWLSLHKRNITVQGPTPPPVEDDMMRTWFELENELNENKVQFARIRDKDVDFVLCQFQNRN